MCPIGGILRSVALSFAEWSFVDRHLSGREGLLYLSSRFKIQQCASSDQSRAEIVAVIVCIPEQ